MGEKLIEGGAMVLDEKGLSVGVFIPKPVKAIRDLAIKEIPTLKAAYWSKDGKDIWVIFERFDPDGMFRYFDLERELRIQAVIENSPLNDIRCVVAECLLPNSKPIQGSIPNAQDGYYFLQWAPLT